MYLHRCARPPLSCFFFMAIISGRYRLRRLPGGHASPAGGFPGRSSGGVQHPASIQHVSIHVSHTFNEQAIKTQHAHHETYHHSILRLLVKVCGLDISLALF